MDSVREPCPPRSTAGDGRRRSAARAAPSAERLLGLQRAAGNRALLRLVRERRLQRSTLTATMDLGGGDPGRDKRKRDDEEDTAAPEPEEKRVERERAGAYTKDSDNATLDRWMRDDGKWHFTYFKATGDYHLKGNTGPARAYQKGFFGGTFKEVTRNAQKKATGPTITDGQAEYLFCVNNIVPRYQGQANYKGQRYS
jgi:hypothetical protein